MPSAELRIAEEFSYGLAEVYSERLLERIGGLLGSLRAFPEMGSPVVRESLTRVYGAGLRQVPVAPFVLLYRYDGTHVDVLALVYGPSVV